MWESDRTRNRHLCVVLCVSVVSVVFLCRSVCVWLSRRVSVFLRLFRIMRVSGALCVFSVSLYLCRFNCRSALCVCLLRPRGCLPLLCLSVSLSMRVCPLCASCAAVAPYLYLCRFILCIFLCRNASVSPSCASFSFPNPSLLISSRISWL